MTEVGFYGKLPSHGDFLRRRVSDAFVGVWDGWLQDCIAASRTALGDRWLNVYLTSPVWRFACAPGVFGLEPVVGLMVPSVDRVGRHFFLTLVAELPPDANIVAATTGLEAFFDTAERLVLETLDAEPVDFKAFDERVAGLGSELEGVRSRPQVILDATAEAILNGGSPASWRVPMGSPPQLAPMLEQLVAQRLAKLYDPLVLWWTEGSASVEPSCLIARGLPHPDAFAALLDGAWARNQWRSIPAHVEAGLPEPETLVEDPTPPRYRSAGATDVGRVRSINQDSFLERPEVGLWVVADGIGGHKDGEVASRMVCDALADFVPDASFEQMVEAAGERLKAVNTHLVRVAEASDNAAHSGSTVVALMARGTRCAILWAGDSRVYRARGGRLEQLTRDHSLASELEGVAAVPANIITRAVGGDPTLELDVYRDRVNPGDRFLLCSDGLTRIIPDAQIVQFMAHEDIRAAVDGLIAVTLAAGAPDNVTVLIVEAYS
ncbi:MAG: type VI secretion system-associated protein TagF [Vicinamibacterales bacterium]